MFAHTVCNEIPQKMYKVDGTDWFAEQTHSNFKLEISKRNSICSDQSHLKKWTKPLLYILF